MSCGLRDVAGFEAAGRPAALIASSAFADAAAAQADGLGHPDLRWILVEHPIQDRTDGELRGLARGAVDAALAAVSDHVAG